MFIRDTKVARQLPRQIRGRKNLLERERSEIRKCKAIGDDQPPGGGTFYVNPYLNKILASEAAVYIEF
jgi:hypothetical protein